MSYNTPNVGRTLFTERDFEYTPRGDDPLRVSQNWELEWYRQLGKCNPMFDPDAKAAAMAGVPFSCAPPIPTTGWIFTSGKSTILNSPSPGVNTIVTGYSNGLGDTLVNEDDRIVSIFTQLMTNNPSFPMTTIHVNMSLSLDPVGPTLTVLVIVGENEPLERTLELDSGGEYFFGLFQAEDGILFEEGDRIEIQFP